MRIPRAYERGSWFYFGRIPSPIDSRDYKLRAFISEEAPPIEKTHQTWDFPKDEPHDQGRTNHCVGFSVANFGINLPIGRDYSNEDGHRFYYKCKEIDGEPGNEEGTTLRSGAKVLKRNGNIEGYAFADSVEEIKWWILSKGPVIAGTIWTSGMLFPNSENIIYPTGEEVGGHAYLLTEWTSDNLIGIQNSWGTDWGVKGKSYIRAQDFESLFIEQGEAVTAVEIEPKKSNCFIIDFIQRIKGKYGRSL